MNGPERRLLALFEDHEDTIALYKSLMACSGYQIIIVARTMDQSLAAAPQLTDMGIRVALVDGNLTKGKRDNLDGLQITEAIHNGSPEVVVIGTPSIGLIHKADHNVGKAEHPQKLFDILTKVFG